MGSAASVDRDEVRLSDEVLMERFKAADVDQDGCLEVGEVRGLLTSLMRTNGGRGVLESMDLHHKVDLVEYLHIAYEIMLRNFCSQYLETGFESCQLKKLLSKEEVVHLMDAMTSLLKSFHCSDQELEIYQWKWIKLYDKNGGEVVKSEVESFFTDIFSVFRFIRQCERKFLQIDVDRRGSLEVPALSSYVQWIVDIYASQDNSMHDESKALLYNEILDMVHSSLNSQVTQNEIPLMVKRILEIDQWRSIYSPQIPFENNDLHPQRRLSQYSLRELSEDDLLALGVAPLAYKKFHELDVHKSGMIASTQVIELIEWVFTTVNKMKQIELSSDDFEMQKNDIIQGFQSDLEHPLDFEEFCSVYDEIFTRIEVKRVWDEKLKELLHDKATRPTSIPVSYVDKLTDSILSAFSKIGYTTEDCVQIKRKVEFAFETWNENDEVPLEDLSALFDGICTKMRLLNNARKKFRDLDQDHDGLLQGAELIQLADWALKAYRPEGAKFSLAEINMMKDSIMANVGLRRVGGSADTVEENSINEPVATAVGMDDMVLIFDEVMEKRRWARRLSFSY